jgi:uncharacterized protein YgfB (UPF0149 family)
MSLDRLPDFRHALLMSHGSLDAAELAECHGVLCGMLCGENGNTADHFFAHLASLEFAVEPGSALHETMVEAFDTTVELLADEELRFRLWLPDDEEPLGERTDSLAHWCTGFLAGLGVGGPLPALSPEAAEALQDVRQIAMAGFFSPDDDSDDDTETEENENAFFEIVEYVRMVTLMLREELRGPGADDPIH